MPSLPWPLDDYIRWIEWRLRELERGIANGCPCSAQDLRIWLTRERDKKSLAEIARLEYRHYWLDGKEKRRNQAAISVVRRAVERVERYLNRSPRGPRTGPKVRWV